MTRPDSGKVSEAATEVDVEVSVGEVSSLTREQLEAELLQSRAEYQHLFSLVTRLFNSDQNAFEELRRKIKGDENVDNEAAVNKENTVKTALAPSGRAMNGSPSRAVTFSSVQTRLVDKQGPDLKLRREATFVSLEKPTSKSLNPDNALSNRLCQLDSYLDMRKGVSEVSEVGSESDHRFMRMATSASESNSRSSSSIGSSSARPRSASTARSNHSTFKNEVYNPSQFVQPLQKHSPEEISNFLYGKKLLPNPGARDSSLKAAPEDVCYEDIVDRNRKRVAKISSNKTSLVPSHRANELPEEGGDEFGGGGAQKHFTPLTSQRTPMKWTKGNMSEHVYDPGFLDDATARAQSQGGNSTAVGGNKKGPSVRRGFTTNQRVNEGPVYRQSQTHAGGKKDRPKSAVARYTEFVYSVPMPVVTSVANDSSAQLSTDSKPNSKTYLRPPRTSIDSSEEFAEMRSRVLNSPACASVTSGTSGRTKPEGGIVSESQIEMKMSKHMNSLDDHYKKSTVALQKKIGIHIEGIVR